MRAGLLKYPLKSLGPGKRVGFWTKGCKRGCYNCMTPNFWAYNQEDEHEIAEIILDIKTATNNKANKITISGGEPFDNKDFKDFLFALRKEGFNDILVYTGYTFTELKHKFTDLDEILNNIDVLVSGPYIDRLNNNSTLKGSSNQRIRIFNSKLVNEYI